MKLQKLIWDQICHLWLVPGPHATSLPEPRTAGGLEVVLWLELSLQVGQVLDQTLKGDSPLVVVLPAFPHQLIHRLRTAIRTWQPLPICQHLHQSDDSHLTVGSTDHTKEQRHRALGGLAVGDQFVHRHTEGPNI